ncbi:MAG: hybrid sensor histidine kinase/response regulator [Bacillales bacterium]|jgi:HPt (histidine-containing phosphotransfer) domain-containing protein|nr:hybrid sensor histidine kinase/response regulator [Bacillales bacterium]
MINSVKIILDVENGIARLGGNKSLYIHLLSRFYENLKRDLPIYEKEFSEVDMKELQKEIHTLKGVSGNLSALALYEGCSALDTSIKSGFPDQKLYKSVVRIYQETQNEVARYLRENS